MERAARASAGARRREAQRAWLHRRVTRMWQRRGLLAWLLLPAAALYGTLLRLRALLHLLGWQRPLALGAPVVVVGNLYTGGTGKTPLTIELVRQLRTRGWRPGVVSRGYGGAAREPRLVELDSPPSECGDEPLLIRAVTRAPVAVGRDRVAAGRLLLHAHPDCNLLIADDGLQHHRLARSFEIALVHALGLGNGWLLPAGPLREPPARLARVDAVVLHGTVPAVRVHSPVFRLQSGIADAYPITAPTRRVSLSELVMQQQVRGTRVLAICAIGVPERFFAMLRGLGLKLKERALPDHSRILARHLDEGDAQQVLMTEKDAVKCFSDPELARDPRIWVVPLHAKLDTRLLDLIETRLHGMEHGSKAA